MQVFTFQAGENLAFAEFVCGQLGDDFEVIEACPGYFVVTGYVRDEAIPGLTKLCRSLESGWVIRN
jgi:hypothetical protein